jgi:hypothetical protein
VSRKQRNVGKQAREKAKEEKKKRYNSDWD